MKNKVLYWSFQIIGWGIYLLAGLISTKMRGDDITRWIPLFISHTLLIIFLTHTFRNYIIRTRLIEKPLKWILIRVAAAVVLISITVNLFTSVIMIYPLELIIFQQYSFQILLFYFLNTSFFIVAWTGIYLTFAYIRYSRKKEIEKLHLEIAARESQINSLKAQINPHFIFNSLNNIRSLMFENTEQASDMITHLSELLRYSMKFSNSGKESISRELEIVQDYLNLQSIHLEDRLNYKITADKNLMEILVPAMSIQLLVENAIKHGIQKIPAGGEIEINIFESDKNVIIEVTNTGKITNDPNSTKIGLKNASERLRLMFGEKSILNLEQISENMVKAKFNIPLS
ncbi:MAG: sensor histidine kinase [Rhodothermaceae bacterium]